MFQLGKGKGKSKGKGKGKNGTGGGGRGGSSSSAAAAIDATLFRNASGFCNHQCRGANVSVVHCFSHHGDQRYPRLLFVAGRNIAAGSLLEPARVQVQ